MFADDYARLSRPVYTLELTVTGLSGAAAANAVAYFDMSAEHVVNEHPESVGWSKFTAGGSVAGYKIGTSAQCVLCSKGDKTNINWGYLHLAPLGGGGAYAGSAANARAAFASTGKLPTVPDTNNPRSSDDDMPAVSATVQLMNSSPARFVVAYDDVASVQYYGTSSPDTRHQTLHWPTPRHPSWILFTLNLYIKRPPSPPFCHRHQL